LDAEMKKEINAIIEKSLPKQLSETLQKRLKELEDKERRLVTTEQSLLDSHEQVKSLQGLVTELNKRVATETALTQREEAVADRETKMEIFELKVRLDAERAGHMKVEGFINALMRNTEFRRSTFINRQPEYDTNGNQRSVPTGETEDSEAH
jgi:uncharacterized protein (DUF3084 family)